MIHNRSTRKRPENRRDVMFTGKIWAYLTISTFQKVSRYLDDCWHGHLTSFRSGNNINRYFRVSSNGIDSASRFFFELIARFTYACKIWIATIAIVAAHFLFIFLEEMLFILHATGVVCLWWHSGLDGGNWQPKPKDGFCERNCASKGGLIALSAP